MGSRATQVEQITRLLMQLSWVAQRQFAQSVARHDLTLPQYLVLTALLHAATHCPMTQLATATHLDAATMTGVVGRLERLGLVARARSLHDRRVVLVRVTPRGEAVVAAVKRTRDAHMAERFATLDETTLAVLGTSLAQLLTALSEERAGEGSV